MFTYCKKISAGMTRPVQKFVLDMVYGLLASQSCYLTEIARTLKEDAALDKVVERLSRNLMKFDAPDSLWENYFSVVKGNFDDGTVLVVDDSDISKPCSSKLEGLCKVHDGSTGEIADGYWYAGVSALTAGHKQPIPVYGRLYSTAEEGYVSNNAETIRSLEFLSAHFPATNIRAFDRGYDAGYVFDYLIPREESFIVRMRSKRNVIHKGKTVGLHELAKGFKGKYTLGFETKDGKKSGCKVSTVPVSLPDYPDVTLTLVICRGLGKEPMLLLTNLANDDNRLGVTVAKVYLMRWRIEEYYKFKKTGFGFEKFLVRSLTSIRNLDMLLSIAIGYIGVLSEKIDESIQVLAVIDASKRIYGLSKFTFYAIADGLFQIFSKLYTGVSRFFTRCRPSMQLSLFSPVY
jgi:hypothetical protein